MIANKTSPPVTDDRVVLPDSITLAEPKQQVKEGFWQGTLGYPQAVVLTFFLFALGMALHILVGYNLPYTMNPVAWLMAFVVPASLVAGRIGRKNQVIHWLTGIPVAVSSTVAVGLLSLVGGVVPLSVLQTSFKVESVWVSWPFVLMVDLMLVNLVGSIGKRCWPLTAVNVRYLANHAGLAIAIIGGAASALFLQREVMVLFPGRPSSVSIAKDGTESRLPFEIELTEFTLNSFPPTLALAKLDPSASDGFTLTPSEDFLASGVNTSLDGYKISVDKYYEKAVYGANGWTQAPWKTAAPAALITVTAPDGRKSSGWVSSGAIDAPQEHLKVNDTVAIVMPTPRPKEFRSDIIVREGGKETRRVLKVNEPISLGAYTVYQLSYDSKAGAASAYSTLEVVRDPGIGVVYLGLGLMLLGSVLVLWNGVSTPTKDGSK
ncbi:MAG: cytochrome c biogenesis protein ResB [Fimbriimonadaceae bacterium]|nr:cytochrome c biogenesis protein ResB [Fimbriimonadaceae bacterium]